MEIITECFDIIKELAEKYRREFKKFDGKGYWGELKQKLALINSEVTFDKDNISKLYFELTNGNTLPDNDDAFVKALNIDEVNLDGSMNEVNHFFIQLFRIPLYEKNNFVKLMQIAFNIGQLAPYLNDLDDGYTVFFTKNKMDKIDTYLKDIKFIPEDIVKILDFVEYLFQRDSEIMLTADRNIGGQIGGFHSEFYSKYKKYRLKTLKVKLDVFKLKNLKIKR
jgi:hypothetical protein